MSAPDGTPIDLRHPRWCDPTRCEAGITEIVGDHRSRIMSIRPEQPYDSATEMWLIQPVHDPLEQTEPWIVVRFTDRRISGEVDAVATYTLRLGEAGMIAEALTTLVELGERRELIDEAEWSGGAS